MSILIKGAKMPSSCAVCPCYRWGTDYVCAITREEPNDFKKRPSWCPLVEIPPHGRLIDVDVFEEMLNSEGGVELKDVPTVIESEEE